MVLCGWQRYVSFNLEFCMRKKATIYKGSYRGFIKIKRRLLMQKKKVNDDVDLGGPTKYRIKNEYLS